MGGGFCNEVTTLILELLSVVQSSKDTLLAGHNTDVTMHFTYMADREGHHADPLIITLTLWKTSMPKVKVQRVWNAEELLLTMDDRIAHYREGIEALKAELGVKLEDSIAAMQEGF